MGTRRTRLLVTLCLLGLSLIGMILGFILEEANVIITSLSTASFTSITYITGKTYNNNTQLKQSK